MITELWQTDLGKKALRRSVKWTVFGEFRWDHTTTRNTLRHVQTLWSIMKWTVLVNFWWSCTTTRNSLRQISYQKHFTVCEHKHENEPLGADLLTCATRPKCSVWYHRSSYSHRPRKSGWTGPLLVQNAINLFILPMSPHIALELDMEYHKDPCLDPCSSPYICYLLATSSVTTALTSTAMQMTLSCTYQPNLTPL